MIVKIELYKSETKIGIINVNIKANPIDEIRGQYLKHLMSLSNPNGLMVSGNMERFRERIFYAKKEGYDAFVYDGIKQETPESVRVDVIYSNDKLVIIDHYNGPMYFTISEVNAVYEVLKSEYDSLDSTLNKGLRGELPWKKAEISGSEYLEIEYEYDEKENKVIDAKLV